MQFCRSLTLAGELQLKALPQCLCNKAGAGGGFWGEGKGSLKRERQRSGHTGEAPQPQLAAP